MKKSMVRELGKCSGIFAASLILLGITYWVKGEPQRYEIDPDLITALQKAREGKSQSGDSGSKSLVIAVPKGFLAAEQIFSQYDGRVIWVDARSRNQWKSDGIEGSLFVSSDPREDFGLLVDDAAVKLFELDSKTENKPLAVVVYCSNKGCSDSKMVAKELRTLEFSFPIFQLYGGYGTLVNDSRVKRRGR